MKNKINLLLFLSMFILSSLWEGLGMGYSFAQQTHWMSLLDGPRQFGNRPDYVAGESVGFTTHESLVDIKQTPDEGYVILGYQVSRNYNYPYRPNYQTAIKLDKNGMLQWNKVVGLKESATGDRSLYTKEIVSTNDGGYIYCGGFGEVTKLDALGDIQWIKSYSPQILVPDNDQKYGYAYSIQQTKDGGYVIAGSTNHFGSGGYLSLGNAPDAYLVKLNSVGGVEWTKTYGNEFILENFESVRQTKDGGYILAGGGGTVEEGGGMLIKTNGIGDVLWSKYYGVRNPYYLDPITGLGEMSGHFYGVEETPDGGYIASGAGMDVYGLSTGTFSGIGLVKIDSAGKMQWVKTYETGAVRCYPTSDGGYVIGGGGTDGLSKLDVNGNIQWNRTYARTGRESPRWAWPKFIITKDTGYALIGHLPSHTTATGTSNMSNTTIIITDTIIGSHYNPVGFNYVVKTDSLGRNGDCQHTTFLRSYVPNVVSGEYLVTVGTGSIVVSSTYTASVYSLVVDNSLCVLDSIFADFNQSTRCDKDSMYFSNYSNAGFYEWDFGDPSSGTLNTSAIETPWHKYSAPGTYTVTLIAKDGEGIGSDTTQHAVKILHSIFLSVSANATICKGDSVQIIAVDEWPAEMIFFNNNGTPYYLSPFVSWTPTDSLREPTNDTTYSNPLSTSWYKASAHNGGCWNYDSVLVTVVLTPTITIYGEKTICQGTSTTLSASGGNNYLWSTEETSALITLFPEANTSYTVNAFNGKCVSTATVTIMVLPSYTVNAGENATILLGEEIILTPTTTGTASWSPSTGLDCIACQAPKAKPLVTTTYYATTKNGDCTSVDSVTIFVINCNESFTIPNAFSPNNDGVNDALILSGTSCFTTVQFTIYNRWGEKVFETDNLSITWDGKQKNKQLDNGVFVYSLTATLINGDVLEKKGNVSLIK